MEIDSFRNNHEKSSMQSSLQTLRATWSNMALSEPQSSSFGFGSNAGQSMTGGFGFRI